MEFRTNSKGQPILQVKGSLVNLNTKEFVNEKSFRVKPGIARITSVKCKNILYFAGKYFKVTKLAFSQNVRYYMLDSNKLKLFVILRDSETQIMGNYPVHYLKLLGRFLAG